MGIDRKLIDFVNKKLLNQIKIGFTFLNIVNEQNLKNRLSKRKSLNRYDKFKFFFYKKVQNGFIKIAKDNPKKYIKINSNLDINFNKKLILAKINKLI